MKKHELIKKAYDTFPAGTEFISKLGTKAISEGCFEVSGSTVFHIGKTNRLIVGDDTGWALITNPPTGVVTTPSLLTGKCAIQVNNEREFKLLMEHYKQKLWYGPWIEIEKYPYYIDYKNDFDSAQTTSPFDRKGETIIPFSDFAAEVGITVPVFVMRSQDGVDLYEGDDYYRVCRVDGVWELCSGIGHFTSNDLKLKPAFKSAWFSIKEATEKWITEQNKPKHATIALYRHKDYKSAEITLDKITIRDGNDIYFLKPSDLEDMLHAYKSLQA